MLKLSATTLLGATLILAGCSGGGGSSGLTYSGPTAPVAITTQDEGTSIAGYAAGQATTGDVGELASLMPVGIAPSTPINSTPQPSLHTLTTRAKVYADLIFSTDLSASNNLLAGTVSDSITIDCDSGSFTLKATVATLDANDDWVPTPGDLIRISFNNCYFASTKEKTNGSITFTLNDSAGYDPITGEFTMVEATYSFNNLKFVNTESGDYGWIDGDYTANITYGDGTTTPLVISLWGSSLVSQFKVGDVVDGMLLSDFSFVDTIDPNLDLHFDHDFTIASTDLGGSIKVETLTEFVILGGALHPTSGVLVVTGANNAKLEVTALSDGSGVMIRYDLNTNGTYGDGTDPADKFVAWADL